MDRNRRRPGSKPPVFRIRVRAESLWPLGRHMYAGPWSIGDSGVVTVGPFQSAEGKIVDSSEHEGLTYLTLEIPREQYVGGLRRVFQQAAVTLADEALAPEWALLAGNIAAQIFEYGPIAYRVAGFNTFMTKGL